MNVTVRVNMRKLQQDLNDIKSKLGDRAMVSALNKTAAQAKTQMSQAIRSDYNISAALVRDRLRIRKAMRNGAVSFSAGLIGNAESGGGKRAMNLVHFLERKTTLGEAKKRRKKGTLSQLHFKVKRVGSKQIVSGAFLGNAGRTVFIRVGKGRLPIKAVTTIGVPQMFSTKRNVGKVIAWINTNFPRIFDAEFNFYMGKAKAEAKP